MLLLILDYNKWNKDMEGKIPNHDKYITTYKFNQSFGTIFDDWLKQAHLATKSGIEY